MSGYNVTTWENGHPLAFQLPIPDPFVRHRVNVCGWRNALRVLFRRYEVEVVVGADRALIERVLELNPDYLGPPGSPSREAWNAQLNDALHRFGEDQ